MKKSVIFSFLLFSTTLSLVPFVTFSSAFTSENPIILPTTTDDNGRRPVPTLPEVLDINGEPLHVSQEYHILPLTWGAGCGVIDSAKIGNTKCPNAVVLQGGDAKLGLPVKFFISNGERTAKDVVRETNQINIMFSIPSTPTCDNGTFWMVGDPDITARGLRFVLTSRVVLAPDGDFTIEKLTKKSPFYKIKHCPSRSICPTCPCSDVGLTSHGGHRRLALTKQPLIVVFNKVQKSTTDA
ncbi:cysteine protease inhibitor 8-like [Lycium ferocissimum]|uniref:cysteine protease inhibitor 8-like n=1 Tax=Lycium ferocissimum TaxID=112874 RepID=UPI00281580F2|nr:cysteine protease inhibitor 8-like [Lycium ferocissimum]